MTYVIGEPCVDVLDRACVEECPVDCIYEGERMLYIHPDECVDCGACEPVCPVEAIYYEEDLPDQWKVYKEENVLFFTETLPGRGEPLGSPGGAAKLGVVGADTPFVAAGSRPDSDRAAWDRELAEVASLALPGEQVPAGPPALVSNTKAAVAAYAEAVSDGVADELRRRLFRAIWVRGLHLSSANEVSRLVTGVMWPAEAITARLASPDFPSLLLRDPDLARIVRRSGGTIAPDGGPLTTAGWRRIRRWRQEWLALPSQVIPAVTGPDQIARPGIEGLRYLASLTGTTGQRPRLPGRAGTAPRRDTRPVAMATGA